MKKQNCMSRFLALAFVACAIAEARAGEAVISLEEKKPYTFTLSLLVNAGYDSNAIQLGDGLPLPEGTSRQGYGFFQVGGTFAFNWTSPDEKQALDLSYELSQQFYETLEESDEGGHTLTATYTQVFEDGWSAVFELADAYTTIEEESYRNRVSFKPRIAYQTTPFMVTHLAGYFAASDTFARFTHPARNADANIYAVELAEVITLKSSKSFRLKPLYAHYWNDGKGSDYEYDRDRFQIYFQRKASDDELSRWYNLNMSAKYVRDFDRYHKLHSRAGPAGFEFKRQDDRDTLNVILSVDVVKKRNHIGNLAINLDYQYIRNDSNIPRFNYDEHILMLGAGITFQ
jgi:hypothetical protein